MLNDITFREFIEYLVTKGSSKSTPVMDWHWDNYVNVCGMCAINYDILGQLLKANFEMFNYYFPGPLKSLFE